jgi:hypothetical protein
MRILPDHIEKANLDQALAAMIAFQDRYDLSVRIEWDPRMPGSDDPGRWKIVANTLGDLTKRENRFEHFGYRSNLDSDTRLKFGFPFAFVSWGSGHSNQNVAIVADPDIPVNQPARAQASLFGLNGIDLSGIVSSYRVDPDNYSPTVGPNRRYGSRPFAYLDDNPATPATARAMLNDEGEVIHVIHGPVPLWGSRRGEDVMLTDALAFDLRVYDPGAPIYNILDDPNDQNSPGTAVEPGDPGWSTEAAALSDLDSNFDPSNAANNPNPAGVGAYVDLGYWNGLVYLGLIRGVAATPPAIATWPGPLRNPSEYGFSPSWFFGAPRMKSQFLPPGQSPIPDEWICPIRVYDTWSFHYENNGINEDRDEIQNGVHQTDDGDNLGSPQIDEGTNGFDDPHDVGIYLRTGIATSNTAGGVDDVSERETAPPYEHPLRGIEAKLRVYERDSRQIREVSVRQHFVPE